MLLHSLLTFSWAKSPYLSNACDANLIEALNEAKQSVKHFSTILTPHKTPGEESLFRGWENSSQVLPKKCFFAYLVSPMPYNVK